jgi:hypothetical protein
MKKQTKAEIKAAQEEMLRNAQRTRELALKAQAELDRKQRESERPQA